LSLRFGGSGIYLVAESIDCGGKGSIISAIKRDEENAGKLVLDLRLLWPSDEPDKIPQGPLNVLSQIYGNDDVMPKYEDLQEFYRRTLGRGIDAIITCEPTWTGMGLKIRKKIIHEVLGLNHTAKDTADAYAKDRHDLISKLIFPAIQDGVDVFCERNFCSSVVYQSSMDTLLSVGDILALDGNLYASRHAPHVYVICDISADTAMERKNARKKQDACKFEVPEFMKKIAPKYRSPELKELLNSHRSMVVYVNTDKPATMDDTESAAREIVRKFREGSLRDGERFNYNIG
jgi:thymidylate kinase